VDLDNEYRETFLAEKHGALQASPILLQDVMNRLQQMQVPHQPVRGPEVVVEGQGLSVEIEDSYLPSEPILFRAELSNDSDEDTVIAEIAPASGDAAIQTITFMRQGNRWEGQATDLPPGTYAIEVRTTKVYPLGPPPVHDLFEVSDGTTF
jgi:hypothetical protein